MFRMYVSIYHSYIHLILALGIVRKLKVGGFITSEYPGIHSWHTRHWPAYTKLQYLLLYADANSVRWLD